MVRLTRPLACIDLETTDPEPTTCAIFDFAVTVLNPDGTRRRWQKLFKPWKPITPEAEEVTGVTNAMVGDCPPFSAYAGTIQRGLIGKDIAGFNVARFDLVALDEELRRCSLKLDLAGVHVIDAFSIFQQKDPRDLTAAVQKYCGRNHEGAHGAAADAEATLDVLESQLSTYEDLGTMEMDQLGQYCRRAEDGVEPVDIAGRLYRKNGEVYYGFGKARDTRVSADPGFGWWCLRQSAPPFPGSTCDALRAILEGR